MPKEEMSTMVIMVPMVMLPNTAAIHTTLQKLSVAAGYIRIGMRGSHGPNRNIVKRIHGVRLFTPSR